MARYAISGSIDAILNATVEVTGGGGAPGDPTALMGGRNVLGENFPSGKVFFLRNFWAYDASAAMLLHLFDASQGDHATGSATTAPRRLLVPCASGELTMVELPSPGLRFTVGCVVAKDTTGASGSFRTGLVGGSGYYE